jgi:phosphotransferase system enzyme I (PtsI)
MLVLSHLLGVEEPTLERARAEAPVVLVARDLTPALTVQLDRDAVLAIACEEGTRTSHAAILAHSIGIPAVMALPEVLERVATGDTVVLDGWAGTLQVEPSEATVEAARRPRPPTAPWSRCARTWTCRRSWTPRSATAPRASA